MTTVVTPAGTEDKMGVNDIKRHIEARLQEFVSAEAKRAMAREDANAENDRAIGTRERILTALADIAHRASWSEDDTKDAIEEAISKFAGNDKRKASSLATFKSDVKLVCSRKVRGHVETTFALFANAFEAEATAAATDSEAPKPLRKAFSRQYHASIAAFKALKDTPNLRFDAVSDCVQFAVNTTRARQIDYDRVKSRLDKIRTELSAFHDDFPVDGLQACVEFLKEIDKSDLKDARARATQGDDDEAEDTAPETQDAPEAAPQNLDEQIADAVQELYAA